MRYFLLESISKTINDKKANQEQLIQICQTTDQSDCQDVDASIIHINFTKAFDTNYIGILIWKLRMHRFDD